MIMKVVVSRKLWEVGQILVEAENETEALGRAREIIANDEDDVEWNGLPELEEEDIHIDEAIEWKNRLIINGRPSRPVLQKNGAYRLE